MMKTLEGSSSPNFNEILIIEILNSSLWSGATIHWGGLNPPHLTHRFVGNVDIRRIRTQDGHVSVGDPYYHQQATGIIIDFLKQTGATEIRFGITCQA